jgi:hypothetical protein
MSYQLINVFAIALVSELSVVLRKQQILLILFLRHNFCFYKMNVAVIYKGHMK